MDVKLFVDGKDVTNGSTIGSDEAVDTVPVVIPLRKPWPSGSLHHFRAVYEDGSCGGDYSEWMHCNGILGFGNTP